MTSLTGHLKTVDSADNVWGLYILQERDLAHTLGGGRPNVDPFGKLPGKPEEPTITQFRVDQFRNTIARPVRNTSPIQYNPTPITL